MTLNPLKAESLHQDLDRRGLAAHLRLTERAQLDAVVVQMSGGVAREHRVDLYSFVSDSIRDAVFTVSPIEV